MPPDARTLYLHIGLPKTGTSFLQSCFHLSRDMLRNHGISYPFSEHRTYVMANGRPGELIEGNATGAFLDLDSLSAHLEMLRGGDHDVLLSSETFPRCLGLPETIEGLIETAARHGFPRIRMLLFLREPLSLMVSNLLQRHKATEHSYMDPAAFTQLTVESMRRLSVYIDSLASFPVVQLTIHNYSRLRDRIVSVTESWLGLPEGSLIRPPADAVNRTLTPDEASLAAAVKRNLSPPFPVFGAFVEQLPRLRAPMRWPSMEEQDMLYDGIRDALASFNRLLPPDEALAFEFREPSPPPTEVSLTGAQWEAIGPELSLACDREASQAEGIGRLRQWMGAVPSDAAGMSAVERFFGQLSAAGAMLGSIDLVGGRSCPGRDVPLSVCGRVSGWAVLDPGRGLAGDAVFLLWEPTEGRVCLYACLPVRRPDVAAALGQDGLMWCGFETREPFDPRGHTGRLHLLVSHAGAMYRNEGLAWSVRLPSENSG